MSLVMVAFNIPWLAINPTLAVTFLYEEAEVEGKVADNVKASRKLFLYFSLFLFKDTAYQG